MNRTLWLCLGLTLPASLAPLRLPATESLPSRVGAAAPDEPAALPKAVPMEPATPRFPYTSEGTTVRLRDGALVHAYNRRERPPEGENWHTHYAPTVIVWAASRDNGKSWGTPELLFTSSSGRTAQHPALIRLANGELGASYNLMDTVDLEQPATGSWVKSVKRAARVFRFSRDEGKTWSPEIFVTPTTGYWTAAHDRLLVLASGRIIQPLHNILSEEPYKIGVRVAYSDDHGRSWVLAPSVLTVEDVIAGYKGRVKPGGGVYAEASVVERSDGSLLLIARTVAGRQYYSESRDSGASWGKPYPSPVASPEAPARMVRVPGTDHLLLIWNSCCVDAAHPLVGRRAVLSSAISRDGGRSWGPAREIVRAGEPLAGMGVNYASIYFDGDVAYVGYFAGLRAGDRTFHQEYVLPIPVAWFYGSGR